MFQDKRKKSWKMSSIKSIFLSMNSLQFIYYTLFYLWKKYLLFDTLLRLIYVYRCTNTYMENNIKIVLRKITIIIENAMNAPYYKSCIQIAAWERRFTQRTYLFRSGLTIDMLPSVIKNWESGCQIRSSCASFVSSYHLLVLLLYIYVVTTIPAGVSQKQKLTS